jgi:hypothetical protein
MNPGQKCGSKRCELLNVTVSSPMLVARDPSRAFFAVIQKNFNELHPIKGLAGIHYTAAIVGR